MKENMNGRSSAVSVLSYRLAIITGLFCVLVFVFGTNALGLNSQDMSVMSSDRYTNLFTTVLRWQPCGVGHGEVPALFSGDNHMNVSFRAEEAVTMLQRIHFFDDCRNDTPCTIVDLGAGHMLTKEVLKRKGLSGVTNYVPVDMMPRYKETVVCDLNALQFPFSSIPRTGKVAFLFLGSFEYVVDKTSILRATAEFESSVVFMQYRFDTQYQTSELQWVTAISKRDLELICTMIGCSISMPSNKTRNSVLLRHRSAPDIDDAVWRSS